MLVGAVEHVPLFLSWPWHSTFHLLKYNMSVSSSAGQYAIEMTKRKKKTYISAQQMGVVLSAQ